MTLDDGTCIELKWLSDRNGQGTVIIRVGSESFTDQIIITRKSARLDLIRDICTRWPELKTADHQQRLQNELEQLALTEAERAEDSSPVEAPKIKDVTELFAETPEDIRAEAEAMLTDPLLAQKVIDDVAALGVAGEQELALSVYLVGISRLLGRPLAAIVQGPSSSGKSYVPEKVSELFPPESVIQATTMTPQALYYMPPGSLEHRFVIAGERSRRTNDEAAEATRAL